MDRDLKRQILILTALVMGTTLTYIMNVVLARNLSIVEFGNYKIVIYYISIISILSLVGSGAAAKKILSAYRADGNFAAINHYEFYFIKFSFKINIILVVLAVFPIFYYFTTEKHLYHHIGNIYFIFGLPAVGLSMLLSRYINVHDAPILSLFPSQVIMPALVIGLVFFFMPHLSKFDTPFILIFDFFILSNVIVLICYFIIFFKKCVTNSEKYQEKDGDKKYWFKTSIGFLISTIIYLFMSRVELLIIKYFSTDNIGAGLFAVVLSINAFFWLAYMVNSVNFGPKIFPLVKDNNKTKLQKNYNSAVIFAMAINFLLLLVVILFGSEILNSFKEQYELAYWPLVIVCISSTLNSPFAFASNILQCSGYLKEANYGYMASLLLSVILGAILVPSFVLIGAAVALMLSRITTTIIICYYLKKKLNLKPFMAF